MATFESMDRRMPKIEACLKANGLESLDAANEMLLAKGIDCDKIIRGVQPICFDNAVWAYTLGTAIAVKRGLKSASDCAAAIGEGLEAFTIPGSVAEQRKVGLGHGNLAAMLLREETDCFCFALAISASFAAICALTSASRLVKYWPDAESFSSPCAIAETYVAFSASSPVSSPSSRSKTAFCAREFAVLIACSTESE